MSASDGIFPNSAHKNLLMSGLRSLNDALPVITTMEACGIECTDYRQGERELRTRIETYLHQFFPDSALPNAPEGVPIGSKGG